MLKSVAYFAQTNDADFSIDEYLPPDVEKRFVTKPKRVYRKILPESLNLQQRKANYNQHHNEDLTKEQKEKIKRKAIYNQRYSKGLTDERKATIKQQNTKNKQKQRAKKKNQNSQL